MGGESLATYYQTNFSLMQHHKYDLETLENIKSVRLNQVSGKLLPSVLTGIKIRKAGLKFGSTESL
jgi:hypothetical protein